MFKLLFPFIFAIALNAYADEACQSAESSSANEIKTYEIVQKEDDFEFKQVFIDDEEGLRKLLSHFHINSDTWIKSISALLKEIKNGECILGIEDGKLHCRVNGVVVKCFYTNDQQERFQLFEEKQVFKNGQIRKRGHRFVAEKLKSNESPEQGALRGLAEELQISGPDVHVVPLFEENRCDTRESLDYIGIQTTYNSYVFSCEISDSHYKDCYVEDQEDKQTFFSWIKI
jgi:hypothetical protein